MNFSAISTVASFNNLLCINSWQQDNKFYGADILMKPLMVYVHCFKKKKKEACWDSKMNTDNSIIRTEHAATCKLRLKKENQMEFLKE